MREICDGTLLLLLELEESVRVALVLFPVLFSRRAVDVFRRTGGRSSWLRPESRELLLRAGKDFADGLSHLFGGALMLLREADRCLLELVEAFFPGDDQRLRATDRALPRRGDKLSLRVGGAMGTTESLVDTGALIHVDRLVPRCRADWPRTCLLFFVAANVEDSSPKSAHSEAVS